MSSLLLEVEPAAEAIDMLPHETVVRMLTTEEAEAKEVEVIGAYAGDIGVYLGTKNCDFINIGVPKYFKSEGEWKVVPVTTTRGRISIPSQQSPEAVEILKRFREIPRNGY